MEKIYQQTLLYDFYGELLTEHQRKVYEDAVYNDLSLGEIAQEYGISRQGVHDLIKRCDRILQDYESKLQLVRKFMEAKEKIGEIMELTRDGESAPEGESQGVKSRCGESHDENPPCEKSGRERMDRIRKIAEELLQEW